jgi:Fe-S cluster assembly iron-binding protein IscA
MIEVTERAQKEIREYFADKPVQPIRLILASSCSGSYLAMALDEDRSDGDESYDIGGITFRIDKELLAQAAPIRMDMVEGEGFTISSAIKFERSGGCGGGCSGCGS